MWLLPAPAGATSTVVAAAAVSISTTASRCSAVQPGPLGGGLGLLAADELRDGPFGGGKDLFFGVEVGQGAVAFLVRRPVDAAAVGGTDTQAGHVSDVRGGDLDDVGAGPAATASLATSSTTAGPSMLAAEDRERPVHLEPELGHRPHRVQLLHLGHRDPGGRALGRIVQHCRCTPGVRGGERGDLLVHGG